MLRLQSYYEDSSPEPRRPRRRLTGPIEAEVCVIGGGWTGLSLALHLAERGRDVVLLEAGRIGAGASGHSGGQMIPGYAIDLPELEAALGRERTRALWALAERGRRWLLDTIAGHAIRCDLRRGYLYAAVKPQHMALVRAVAAAMEALDGHGARVVDAGQARALVSSPCYLGGLYDAENAGHLHPLGWALGLARAAEAAGARLFEDSPAVAIDGGRVRTRAGSVRARHIAVCANAWTPELLPATAPRLGRVSARMIATQPLDPAELIPSDIAVCDANNAMDYYRLSADHRLLFGSAAAGRAPDLRAAARSLAARARRVFPHVPEIKAEYVWQAPVSLTRSRLPCLGRSPEGVWHAAGFSGHGVILTHLAGRLLGEAILGRDADLKPLAGLPCPALPGGPLRRPLFLLGLLWRRILDRF